MTAVKPSQSEIVARLLEIHAARKVLDIEQTELLARLKNQGKTIEKPVPLAFGENAVTWGDGQVLVIRGKGYKFIKALYESDKMRIKKQQLERHVWGKDKVKHHTFTVLLHWLSEKLEIAKFPYRLLPTRSKEQIITVEHKEGEKPVKKRLQSEITGAKLVIR